jgi:quercetin dioxygenase-like cupin family protein
MSEDSFWFLNTLVTIRAASTLGGGGLSVIEHRAPVGDSPPLHIHRTEDEAFVILEGDFSFQVGPDRLSRSAGAVLIAPKHTPHTYRVDSRAGGRFVTVTNIGDFERFVRAMGRKPERLELPPPVAPSAQAIETLSKIASQYGIDIVGPPLAD